MPEKRKKQFTLRKEERLRLRDEIDRLFESGLSASDKKLTVIALPNKLGFTRMAVGVSKKWGDAVRRNRLKRVLREAFRLAKGGLPPSLDLMILPRVGVKEMTLDAAMDSLMKLSWGLAGRVHRDKTGR